MSSWIKDENVSSKNITTYENIEYNIFLTLYKEGSFNQGLNAYVGKDISFQY